MSNNPTAPRGPAPAQRPWPAWWFLSLLIAGAVSFSLFVIAQRFWLDDSFISFRYARNLVQGLGLVYNEGQLVEGYTNFLWTLVAALGLRLGVAPIYFTQAWSLGCQALTLWLVYRIGLRSTGLARRALVAPALLAGQIAFLAYPMTGMESTFYATLITLACYLLLAPANSRARAVALGLVLLGIGLTRFDGFVIVGILAVFILLIQRDWRRLLLPLGLCVGGLVIYNAWRLSYYPAPLPNSFYAKTSFSLDSMVFGAKYVLRFVVEHRLLLVLLAALPFVLRRTTPVARLLGWLVACQLGYVVLVGGDWMPHYRFLFHVLPLACVLAQEGLWQAWDILRPRVRRVGLVGAALLTAVLAYNLIPLMRGLEFSDLEGPQFHPADARRIGQALDRLLPEGRMIAVEWGGILPYYVRHEVLDTFGITDADITSRQFPKTVWGSIIDLPYLVSRRPDLVVPCARLFETSDRARRSTAPGGPCHYSHYMDLAGEEFGYRLEIVGLETGKFWPALVHREEVWP